MQGADTSTCTMVTSQKTIALMFLLILKKVPCDGSYFDLNGSIQNYQSPESGPKRDRTPQLIRSHLCEHQLKRGS